MAWGLVVCSMTLCRWRAPETSLSPISQLFKSPQKWCCPGNVEYHRFPRSKSRFVSQWPENPTICRDTEMAWCLVVCSMILWQCRALETSLYPIFRFFFGVIWHIFSGKNCENCEIDLPLFEELGQTSRDLSDTWSETLKSRDVCLNSLKNGVFYFLGWV